MSVQIPQRTCLGCRQRKDKSQLVRIVRTPQGKVEVDLQAQKPGRGAYLCPRVECWEQGLKAKRLAYALRGPVGQDEVEGLKRSALGSF